MPVISLATSKGGAGKTTSAIVLATTLARNHTVTLIDADPAARLEAWSRKGALPADIQIMRSRGERRIHDEIDRARSQSDFVIVDVEGVASRLNAFIMGESDLVVIPMGDEQPDAEAAIETLAQLALEARSMRREVPVRILFCRTQVAVKSRQEKSLNAQVRDKVGAFSTELHRRVAFSALHSFGGDLYDMDREQVTGVDKAIANAELFATEIKDVLRAIAALTASGASLDPNRPLFGQKENARA